MSDDRFKLSAVPTVREKLRDHTNYQEWRQSVLRLVRMLRLTGILDGSIPRPKEATTDSTNANIHDSQEEWDAADARLATMIEFN